jgi:GT2 family glycosyltransferase
MDLSILIISYNTKKLTLDALRSLFKSLKDTKIKYEVLLLDNNSTDNSVSSIKKEFKNKVKLFALKENLGFGKGNNYLVKKASGEVLVFLNSDTKIINNGIFKLYDYFLKTEARYQFIGPKLFNKDLTVQYSAGPFYSLLIIFVALFLKGDYFGITRYSPNKSRAVDWVSGACFITKKKYYNAVGGFDENIFMYMEEIDLFYRARKIGYQVGFYPGAKVLHYGSASSQGRKEPIINVYKGFIYFYQKHHNKNENYILKLLLKTKAMVGYTLGAFINNKYLKETYAEANKLV